ncbi:uncharacterized protein A1O9_05547 [Exophiala aquamarina CBS 119918]|uniref:Plasma membrane fusion protein PRM1 n=1 Tax=Exophiala aquamarina CBS 119918 TaxID=1182545 RepID=A0A072PBX9_9EURO|nr:uncharacterized protein A1O9_05547 [Exophiala aquamarina CBS 119918]KEF57629.1 hypothetical protein A1O9_05547 [Exophiala aquamarina CBS 119918]
MSAPSAFAAGRPPSMPAGNQYEIRDYYSNQDPPRSLPHNAPSITPYLGLRARLSQIWFNRWTILLLLVLIRTLIAIAGIDNNLASARREALSACSEVESMGSTMASMPHYMSQGVNELAAKGVEKSVNGLMEMSTLSVTAVEEIAVFVIGMMTNTYLCLITLAVTGSLQSVIGVLDSAQKGLNTLTKTLGDDLGSVVGDFEDKYNSLVKSLSSFFSIGGQIPTPPTLDLSKQEDAVRKLQLPPNLDAELQKLNKSIPTFDEVKNFTESIIRLPFEEVKKLMAESMGNYTFNRSVFPVPQKEQLSFCGEDDGINDFFNKLTGLAHLARRVFIGVLVVLAVLVMIPMAWREIKRYRRAQERSLLVNANARDPMDIVYLVSRPYSSSAGLKLSRGYESQRKKNLIRWVIAYATSEAALFVLAIALAGLFACLCQAILLSALAKQVPALSDQVGAFSDKVVAQLNNASEQWAVGTNAVITSTGQDINTDMLGWVNTTTTAINDTLNMFVDKTTEILNDTFGGTPLYDPIMDVLNCLALMKIAGIQKGLTWVSDHAHVEFPLLENDTFSLGAVQSLSSSSDPDDSFLSLSGDATSDRISSAVARFIDTIEDGIRTEALISTGILLLWVFIVFTGVIRALTLWYGRDKVRGDGGEFTSSVTTETRYQTSDQFRSENQDRYSGFTNIPLSTVHTNHHVPPMEPAPKYTPAPKDMVVPEAEFQGPKLASQRPQSYGTSNPFGDDKRADLWNRD